MIKNLSSTGLKYENGKLLVLDQTLLPQKEIWIEINTLEDICDTIYQLKVRGAPLIGVTAALALSHLTTQGKIKLKDLLTSAQKIRDTRPTAVNLMWAIDKMISGSDLTESILEQRATQIFEEDVLLATRMADNGFHLFQDGDNILTHCNTGGLATVGVGTALGVLINAHKKGKKLHVYVDETRPLLQGSRLTTWELEKNNIPYTLICDNMAGFLMKKGKISKAIVGSDRIALNGDFANKIGTYSVAVQCHYHKVPFYVAAPYSTIDFKCPNGDAIPIEERHSDEVRGVKGSFGYVQLSPSTSQTFNPSFDVTPHELVTGWVLDKGFFNLEQIKKGVINTLN